jgi:hypothetical protein
MISQLELKQTVLPSAYYLLASFSDKVLPFSFGIHHSKLKDLSCWTQAIYTATSPRYCGEIVFVSGNQYNSTRCAWASFAISLTTTWKNQSVSIEYDK